MQEQAADIDAGRTQLLMQDQHHRTTQRPDQEVVRVGSCNQWRTRVVTLRGFGRTTEVRQHGHHHGPVGRVPGDLGTPGQFFIQQRAQFVRHVVALGPRKAGGHVTHVRIDDCIDVHHFVSLSRNPPITRTWSRQASANAA